MKTPEKAPKWSEKLEAKFPKLFRHYNNNDFHKVLNQANKDYLYWDKFKYLNFPDDISPEDAWGLLKFTRISQRKETPIKDVQGNNFWYWLPDVVLKNLSIIDRQAAGDLLVNDTSINQSPQKDRFLISSIMEEAIASSQLEGAATTRKKAKKMLREGQHPKNHAEKMIHNNFQTIKWLKEVKDYPLTPELIKEIQKKITFNTLKDGNPSGRFQAPNEERVVVGLDNKIIFTPPPAKEIEGRIRNLCDFSNQEDHENEFIHPVIKASWLHFWLAYIHPFPDGNGRTARALFYWYMLKKDYWLFEYISISRIVLKAPSQYIRAYLYSEMDELDVTYFLSFHVRVIVLALQDLKSYLLRKQNEVIEGEKLEEMFPDFNIRQLSLLRHALKNQNSHYTIKNHQNIFKTAYQTARNDLLQLEIQGLMKCKRRGNKFYFSATKSFINKCGDLV